MYQLLKKGVCQSRKSRDTNNGQKMYFNKIEGNKVENATHIRSKSIE